MSDSASRDLDQAANRVEDPQRPQTTLHCGSWVKKVDRASSDASHMFRELAVILQKESDKADPKPQQQSAAERGQCGPGSAEDVTSASPNRPRKTVDGLRRPDSVQERATNHERDLGSRRTDYASRNAHPDGNAEHPLLHWRSQAASQVPPYLPANKDTFRAQDDGKEKSDP